MTSEPVDVDRSNPATKATSWAALSALGVVFGDLGTSPLYTLQTVVQAAGGRFSTESALGILSLIFWTLIITISIKYCLFVMRADNRGEGGILALMSLVGANSFARGVKFLSGMGLLGAALIYGDGAITPAISVLSALEGVNVVTTSFKPFVMPTAVLILILLFLAQRVGTEKIGRAFGPVMLLWFAVIALLGALAIVRQPAVLAAIDPSHAVRFLAHSGGTGLLVLGGVFLCITGGEALYADMGHFGKGPIRWSWYVIVLPALLLSYAGQTAYLIEKGTVTGNPFYEMAPAWSIYPLVALATVATIIASQAIITGSFSMTRQAVQLGWLPGVAIRQTSDAVYGQIYVPIVNWLMMIATVGITIGFGSSDRLAGAYGTAVATTMLLTTGLLYVAMRRVWRWPLAITLPVAGLFLFVDAGFFAANLLKIAEGGWLPLTFALLLFILMLTWRAGIDAVKASLSQVPQTDEQFLRDLESGKIPRVDGTMVFLTRSTHKVSRLTMDHVHFMGALPRHVISLSVVFVDTPRVEVPNCTVVSRVTEGWWQVVAQFGFVEIPDLRRALRQVQGLDPAIDLDNAVFIASRDLIVHKPGSQSLGGRRLALFAFLYRNAVKAVDRFHLPPQNVVEIARQLEI
ncbi:MAG: KUP/HAK/KT family potassium transporter [Steroidobacteraceae bacterium]|jgi:KUP system potassium uptake protein